MARPFAEFRLPNLSVSKVEYVELTNAAEHRRPDVEAFGVDFFAYISHFSFVISPFAECGSAVISPFAECGSAVCRIPFAEFHLPTVSVIFCF